MSIYTQSSIVLAEDGLSSKQVRHTEAPAPVAAPVADPDVELVDEPDEKPVKARTKAELVEVLVGLGVAADVAEGLTKAELTEAISRMTHAKDD